MPKRVNVALTGHTIERLQRVRRRLALIDPDLSVNQILGRGLHYLELYLADELMIKHDFDHKMLSYGAGIVKTMERLSPEMGWNNEFLGDGSLQIEATKGDRKIVTQLCPPAQLTYEHAFKSAIIHVIREKEARETKVSAKRHGNGDSNPN